ncbi:MAG: hypothetical protein K2X93_14630 [Candidatus Obscuribacterales bacterium]|nr:hypothetical protein [Candidatus Obscuribacterales bacterium]
MQYFLCPRCSFKVPGNRRSCHTCGYEVPKAVTNISSDTDEKSVSRKANVWAKVLGFSQQEGKPDEKPALG